MSIMCDLNILSWLYHAGQQSLAKLMYTCLAGTGDKRNNLSIRFDTKKVSVKLHQYYHCGRGQTRG